VVGPEAMCHPDVISNFDSLELRDVWMEISRSKFLLVDVEASHYFGTLGLWHFGTSGCLDGNPQSKFLWLLRRFGLREILNATMNISRTDFHLVDVVVSRYFGTSGLRGFRLGVNPCTTLKLQFHESR
jgi:hypothetical protein